MEHIPNLETGTDQLKSHDLRREETRRRLL